MKQQITNSEKCVNIFRSIWDLAKIKRQEQVYVLYLNSDLEVIQYEKLSSGNYTGVQPDLRTLVVNAINMQAHSIVLAHNHPQGDAMPSKQDISFTQRLKDAFKLFHINVLDSIILTTDKYFSFTDNALLN